MKQLLNIITPLHKRATRDYLGRMQDAKIECMKVAKKYGQEFWDGDRRFGYGGYRYDGRWKVVAEQLIELYHLPENAKILDVGCGKGHLLFELKKLLPKSEIAGFDISEYAVKNAKEEIRDCLFTHKAEEAYPYPDKNFDLVISLTTLHNLQVFELKTALREIERVGKDKYLTVEAYRNDAELFNLECWALTCAAFHTPQEWVWLLGEFGYSGDYEFIYFE